jgi:hypothetical protein
MARPHTQLTWVSFAAWTTERLCSRRFWSLRLIPPAQTQAEGKMFHLTVIWIEELSLHSAVPEVYIHKSNFDSRRSIMRPVPVLNRYVPAFVISLWAPCQRWAQGSYATNRKVAGSRPDEENISIYLIFPTALVPVVHSASYRNEYQKQKNYVSGEWSAVGA